jgi:redox-sensitive bicupin YhaK (pirin superfamily)
VRVGASGTVVPKGTLAVLGDGASVMLRADGADARLLLVGGKPLSEPVARYGPFVMNTEAEIHQAVQDFQTGRL